MILVHVSGLCQPNPGGTVAWGMVVEKDGLQVERQGGVLRDVVGVERNGNAAQYLAVEQALSHVLVKYLAEDQVVVASASELCARQLSGEYRVGESLAALHARVGQLVCQLSSSRFVFEGPIRNPSHALARQALKKGIEAPAEGAPSMASVAVHVSAPVLAAPSVPSKDDGPADDAVCECMHALGVHDDPGMFGSKVQCWAEVPGGRYCSCRSFVPKKEAK